jgi:prophage regulatory protein
MEKILRVTEVLKLTGLSRTTVWRMIQLDEFPTPVALGRRAVGWRASDVETWISGRPPQSRKSVQ